MVDLYSEVLRIRLTVKCNLVTESALGGRGFVQFVCLNYHCSIQIKLNAPKGHFANTGGKQLQQLSRETMQNR
jgi:hypothetical protein